MGLFDDLANVEVRDEVPVRKSDLEKVLDYEEKIIKQYKNDERFKHYSEEKELDAYQSLYTTVQEKLADINITSELLQKYIDARDNTTDNNLARIRGMYSAALLEIISTKTPDVHTFINGRGRTFNFLFYYIHNIKNISVTNIIGHNTLGHAGSNNGSATNITLTNITGDHTLYKAGSNGNATNIVLNDIKGNNTLTNAGENNGSVANITLSNITGNNTLETAAWNGGSATNITLINITGKKTLFNACGNNGIAKNITVTKIKGDYTLYNAGGWNGSAKNITVTKIKGDWTLYNAIENGSITNILQENELTEKQKSILSQIESIVETMHTLSSEKQKKAHEEIARLQEEIFAEEKQ